MPVPSCANEGPPPYSEIDQTRTDHPMERVAMPLTVTLPPPPPYSELDPARNSGRIDSAPQPPPRYHYPKTCAEKLICTLFVVYIIGGLILAVWTLIALVQLGQPFPLFGLFVYFFVGFLVVRCVECCTIFVNTR